MLRLVNKQIPSLKEANPEAPDELVRICERALAPETEARYATAAEFQADLEAYLDSKDARVRPREIANFLSDAGAKGQGALKSF